MNSKFNFFVDNVFMPLLGLAIIIAVIILINFFYKPPSGSYEDHYQEEMELGY